jgi:hypothetical protein
MMMARFSKAIPESGVIYIATSWIHYLIEACHSIESLRENVRDVHVTVITDISQARFILGSMADNIIFVPRSELYSRPYAHWTYRLECLRHSPYSKTVFLDTDTRILSDKFHRLFGILKEVDIAMAECNNSRSASLLKKRIFNAGVIAFQNNPLIKTVFQSWLTLQTRYLESIWTDSIDLLPDVSHVQDDNIKKWLLTNDQTSLAAFLSPNKNLFRVRLKILDLRWNYCWPEIPLGQDVIVHHAPRYKVNMEATKRFIRQRLAALSHRRDEA